MTNKKADRYFLPTLDCLLLGGSEAITSFADKPKKNDDPKKHVVVITQNTLEELSEAERGNIRAANYEEKRLNTNHAREALHFLNSKLKDFSAQKENYIGDELYVMLSDKERIEDVPDGTTNSVVVCRYEGERLQFLRKGRRAEMAKFSRIDPNIRREGTINLEDDKLYDEVSCMMSKKQKTADLSIVTDQVERVHPNQYLIFNRSSDDAETVVGFIKGNVNWREENGRRTSFYMDDLAIELHPLHKLMQQQKLGGGSLRPRNLEQAIYMHALQQEHIALLFVTGGPGTGKTIVGYGSALAQTLPQIPHDHPTNNPGARGKEKGDRNIRDNPMNNRFENIYITKARGRIGGDKTDDGFLPGSERAKLDPSIQSYIDAHNALKIGAPFSAFEYVDTTPEEGENNRKEKARQHKQREISNSGLLMPQEGIIHIENYGNWRGRTMGDSVVFLDEAQNFLSEEMIHLIQRMGFGSQYIISGDYESQIDDQNVSATNNGLFYAIKHFIDQPYSAVISLEKSQRHMAAAHAHKMPRY